jgi:hypothetical protein
MSDSTSQELGIGDHMCLARSKDGYGCTLLKGHPSDHIAHGLNKRVCDQWPQDPDEKEVILTGLKQFVELFGVNHPQQKWSTEKILDERVDNQYMIGTAGDTICFGDPNHQDPDDKERFELICKLANSVPRIIKLLEG